MADQTQLYLDSAAIAGRVISITGKPGDGLSAGGYAAWIESITGSPPQVIDNRNGTVKIVLSQSQILSMRQWLDSQVKSAVSLKTGPAPSVQVELGPVLTPWAFQYAMPLMIGTFTLGWLAHWLLARR
jgi:hypothetical protein